MAKTLIALSIALLLLHNSSGTNYKVTDQIYLDISIDGEYVDRIVIGLFGEIAPKTVKNFKTIATSGIDGKTYKGSTFHKVVKRFMIQGGDIANGDGSGSISIFGKEFDDENFDVKHTAGGFVSMANRGSNTNGCQFFITTIKTPWLDGKHTVFGKVVRGQRVVHKIEQLKTDVDDRPIKSVYIEDCGMLPTEPFIVSDEPYELIEWFRAGAVPLGFSIAVLSFFHCIIRKLQKF